PSTPPSARSSTSPPDPSAPSASGSGAEATHGGAAESDHAGTGRAMSPRSAHRWLPMPPVTPFTLLADRVSVGRRGLYWATSAALVMSVVLMVTGGIVRVTGSGLGCPDWPSCTEDSITT